MLQLNKFSQVLDSGSRQGLGVKIQDALPVVKTPKATNVAAMPTLGPKGVAEVSRNRMIGLVKMVTPQLKRLSFCMIIRPFSALQALC